MIQQYALRDAQARLQQLLDDAQAGKTIVILDENDRAVQLVPLATVVKPRTAGSARGQVKLADDFDAPLADFDEHQT